MDNRFIYLLLRVCVSVPNPVGFALFWPSELIEKELLDFDYPDDTFLKMLDIPWFYSNLQNIKVQLSNKQYRIGKHPGVFRQWHGDKYPTKH